MERIGTIIRNPGVIAAIIGVAGLLITTYFPYSSKDKDKEAPRPNVSISGVSLSGDGPKIVAGGDVTITGPSTDEIIKLIIKVHEEQDKSRPQQEKVAFKLQKQESVKKTIETLKAEKGPGIEEALELLAKGNTEKAEAIFYAIAEQAKAKLAENSKVAAEALINAGNLAYLHDTQKAEAAYREATKLDPQNLEAWNQLGNILKQSGDLQGAGEAFLKVEKLAGGNKEWQAIAYSNLGFIYQKRGDLAKAEDFCIKALDIYNGLNNKEGMANIYSNLGSIYQKREDLTKAEEFTSNALSIAKEIGDKAGMATNYNNLGVVYQRRGDLAKAKEFHSEALKIDQETGNQDGIISSYGNLGLIYRTWGDLTKAEEFHSNAIKIAEEMGDKESMAGQYGNLGIVYQKRGDLAKAEKFHSDSLKIAEEMGDKESMATQYGNIGLVYKIRGDV